VLEEKGVIIEVWFEGKKLMPSGNGYLGEFNKGNFQLTYALPENKPIICFTRDGKRNIIPTKAGHKTIPVTLAGNDVFTTIPASNNIRFAVIDPTGKCEIWKTAILSQDGVFFLAEQKTYEAQWFRDENDRAVCPYPYFADRPQLTELLRPMMENKQLPSISEFRHPPFIDDASDLPKGQGRVLFWDLPEQWGLIAIDGKGTVARVHWKSLPPDINGGLRRLKAGQIVSFQTIREVPTTARTTTVVLEAKGVTPL
jgi:hypothetical protein